MYTVGVMNTLQKKQRASVIHTKLHAKLKVLPKAVQIMIVAIIAFVGAALIKVVLSGVLGLWNEKKIRVKKYQHI